MGKIAKKAVCRSVFFDNLALYFECRINKNALPSDCCFGDNIILDCMLVWFIVLPSLLCYFLYALVFSNTCRSQSLKSREIKSEVSGLKKTNM